MKTQVSVIHVDVFFSERSEGTSLWAGDSIMPRLLTQDEREQLRRAARDGAARALHDAWLNLRDNGPKPANGWEWACGCDTARMSPHVQRNCPERA